MGCGTSQIHPDTSIKSIEKDSTEWKALQLEIKATKYQRNESDKDWNLILQQSKETKNPKAYRARFYRARCPPNCADAFDRCRNQTDIALRNLGTNNQVRVVLPVVEIEWACVRQLLLYYNAYYEVFLTTTQSQCILDFRKFYELDPQSFVTTRKHTPPIHTPKALISGEDDREVTSPDIPNSQSSKM